jgi:hypothetical protein
MARRFFVGPARPANGSPERDVEDERDRHRQKEWTEERKVRWLRQGREVVATWSGVA